MRASDIATCVKLIEGDPVLGPRYGPAIHLLPAVWLRLLGRESFRACVFEKSDSGSKKIIQVGVAVFVADDFVRRLKTPPFMWIGPALSERAAVSHSPLLSDREVALANSNGTLTRITWSSCIHPQHATDPRVLNFAVRAFIEMHSGYNLREVIVQAESEHHL